MHTVRSSGCILGRVVSASGGCLLLGGCLICGGCLLPGVCSRGVSALRGLLRGLSAPGVSAPGGVCSRGGVWYPSMHWGRHPPCGQTHACKNITFATSLRTVTNKSSQNIDNIVVGYGKYLRVCPLPRQTSHTVPWLHLFPKNMDGIASVVTFDDM